MALLRSLPKLSCLGLASLGLGTTYSLGVLSTLQEFCPGLTLLDLSDNGVSASGGAAIGAIVQSCTALEELDLCWNSLGNFGIKDVCDVLANSRATGSLRWLDLSWNSIGCA
jgi:Ran GTPase-activating protein (RanGAP) involved in mRNA processing and transport